MIRLVCPTFYEEGDFDFSETTQIRMIQNKHIYAINCINSGGQRNNVEAFYIPDDGKLRKRRNGDNLVFAPLMPGTYWFHTSRFPIPDYERVLNRSNSEKREITDDMGQEIILPWCFHNNGAEAVAEYILAEIYHNSRDKRVIRIARMNDRKGQITDHIRSLSPVELGHTPPPPDMRAGALGRWLLLVRPNGVWDHKPLIAGDQNLVNNSVLRPIRKNGPVRNAVFHKYGNHDYFYDVWSNIHYGYVGKVCGFTDNILLQAPGLLQIATDLYRAVRTRNSSFLPRVHDSSARGFSRFDDVPDQQTIALGIVLFNETEGNPDILTSRMILDGLVALGNAGLLQDNRVKHICFDENTFTRA